MRLTVAYAGASEQCLVTVELPAGSRIRHAVEASGILKRFPAIRLSGLKVGIHGRLATLEALLQSGDRVEIYRPLLLDPKEIRRERELARSKRFDIQRIAERRQKANERCAFPQLRQGFVVRPPHHHECA